MHKLPPLARPSKQAISPTVIVESEKLNIALGMPVLLALETFQQTGSFKFRAAYNVATNSTFAHLVTASSGNFGQALAYACKLTGKACTVVMPSTSSQAKVAAVKNFGGQVRLVDVLQKSRAEWLQELVAELGEVEAVSPYDDSRVIEGNSSLAEDLLPHCHRFDCVIVPIGGGGLSSGLIVGFGRNGIDAEVFGAEPLLANDAARSLRAGSIISNDREPMTLADGARTLSVGKKNWEILKDGLAGIIEVDEDSIAASVRLLFNQANVKAEPTGALGTGALLSNKERFAGRKPLLIVSGGNVDPDLFARLIA